MDKKPTQKQLDQEGLTKEYLNTVDMSVYSPVQLMPGDEPCRLLKCAAGYWVKDEDDLGYIKDRKGQLFVVSEREALVGRARYILNHKKEILEEEIKKEVLRLEKKVEDYITPVLEKVKDALCNLGLLTDSVRFIRNVIASQMSESKKDLMIQQSKQIVALFSLEKYQYYKQLIDDRNFDKLYMMLFQDGLPQIGNFSYEQMDELKSIFGQDVINETIDDIEGKSHLYKIAYINVKRRNDK